MAFRTEQTPGIGPYRRLLLDMAQERSVEAVLRLIVDRLSQLPDAALARIWLLEPGDICPTCPMAAECPDRTACLHLVSSAGRSLEDGRDWSGLGGRFRRFPLGVYKVGLIASRAEAIEVPDLQEDGTWLADPGWARRERIRGFAGQPLASSGAGPRRPGGVPPGPPGRRAARLAPDDRRPRRGRHRQCPGLRGDRAAARPGRAGERLPPRGGQGRLLVRGHRRQQPRPAGRPRAGRPGRPDRRRRPDPRASRAPARSWSRGPCTSGAGAANGR